MTKKYFGGIIPESTETTEFDESLKAEAAKAYEGFTKGFDDYKIADAVESAMELARRANKYIDETTPWALAKGESKKAVLGTVIYNLLELLFSSAL